MVGLIFLRFNGLILGMFLLFGGMKWFLMMSVMREEGRINFLLVILKYVLVMWKKGSCLVIEMVLWYCLLVRRFLLIIRLWCLVFGLFIKFCMLV